MHRYFAFAASRLPNGMPTAHRKETESVRQLSAGDPTAWAQLVEHWSPCLYNYLIHNTVSEAEAPKLMRGIFSAVIQALVGSRRVANPAVLIFATTYRHVLHYRQQQHERMGKKQWPSVASANGDYAKASNFSHIFQQFSPDVQQILLLHYRYGVSLQEISQIVDQSEVVLTKTLYQAKLHLQ